tara:strand:- start:1002 stop:1505 length:504 start_codon:yes stop_codon:yes gene_type:complete
MNQIDTQLKYEAIKTMSHCIEQARCFFNQSFPHPTLSFKLRGRAAGKAYLHLNEVRLNPVLFSENQHEFLTQVIPHEVAHIIVHQLYGKVKPHGKEWQAVMNRVFGLPAQTTHNFQISSVEGKTFEYHCGCTKHLISLRRHNKVIRGQAQYRCKKCQSELKRHQSEC